MGDNSLKVDKTTLSKVLSNYLRARTEFIQAETKHHSNLNRKTLKMYCESLDLKKTIVQSEVKGEYWNDFLKKYKNLKEAEHALLCEYEKLYEYTQVKRIEPVSDSQSHSDQHRKSTSEPNPKSKIIITY
ncbi:MAG TPA: hypothetical protein VF941_03335 [Clostridia bacterium]